MPRNPSPKTGHANDSVYFGTEKVPQKNLCDKDFAKLLGELSGAIRLKTLVLLGSALDLFRKFFGVARAILFGFGVLYWVLISEVSKRGSPQRPLS